MDIGKYIGKFLLKNKYCSLPGLGVFELKKSGASLHGNELEPPTYQISFSPIGSIDDTFASFIATHENVSISNASNNIKEFCKTVKEDIAKTGGFDIDHLGKLVNSNGKIAFRQSSDLDLSYTPISVPVAEPKPAPVSESTGSEYSYPPALSSYARKRKSAWLWPVLGLLLLGLLGGGGYFGYTYWKKKQAEAEPVSVETLSEPTLSFDTAQTALPDTLSTDSNTIVRDSMPTTTPPDSAATATAPAAPVATGALHQIVIMSSPTEAVAAARSKKLNSWGHQTQVVNRAGQFMVTISSSHPSNDTLKLVDSIRKVFNPGGNVFILK
jgi:hypothetical protein